MRYALQRTEVAKPLGIIFSALDKFVMRKQKEDAKANTTELVEPITPSPDPVDALELANYIELTVLKHIALKH